MKILFFLALLANLVFFLWQYNVGGFHQPANESERITANTQQIWLLSELEKKPPVAVLQPEKNNLPTPVAKIAAAAVKAPVPTAASPVKTLYCYRIKGFTNKAAATRWTQQQSVHASSLRLKENPPVVADYVVNYPAVATLTGSKKKSGILKQRGIKNFFMINRGEFKGAISLGVFKNESRAIKAQHVLIQKGINAKVSKRYKTAATVSAQIKTEQTRSQLLATLSRYTHRPSVESSSQCE